MELNTVKKYYEDITNVNIIDIAEKILFNRITARNSSGSNTELLCDCPNHASSSKKSLNISSSKQSWYCFGCGTGGDVLHLVEFVKFGTVSHGSTAGQLSDTHRQSRNYLADYCNLPHLSNFGVSKERLAQGEKSRQQSDRTAFVMGEILKYYHYELKKNVDIFDNLKCDYAITDETARSLLIGFAPADQDVNKITAFFKKRGISMIDLTKTGFFAPTNSDNIQPFFNGRLIFPYWSRGQVRFAIGRKTIKTPDTQWEQGKYKKLPTWNEHTRSYVCQTVKNDLLYNEDILNSKPEKIIITEGITDCIVLNSFGFNAISPVTVRIKDDDWPRIISKLYNVKTVYLCLDNEVSGIGLDGARKAARILSKHDIDSRIITIPLGDKQKRARGALLDDYNIAGVLAAAEKKALLNTLEGNNKTELEQLLHNSKTDPNEFFVGGGTVQEFKDAVDSASTVTELQIKSISLDLEGDKLEAALDPIIAELATASPMRQEREINAIVEHLGKKKTNAKTIKSQLNEEKKRQKRLQSTRLLDDNREEGGQTKPGSCRQAMQNAEREAKSLQKEFTPQILAEKIADWFENNGGKFFFFPDNEGCLFFDNDVYSLDSSNRPDRRKYRQFLYRHTGLVDTISDGRTVIETLACLSHNRGDMRDRLTWLHSNVSKHEIFFNLSNEAHGIAKITPGGVEIVKNGANADNVLLGGSDKMQPVVFNPDIDRGEIWQWAINTLCKNMSCDQNDAVFVLLWLSTVLFLDFVSTRPATRFEGGAASGKTTGAKLITTLLYGSQHQKRSTNAANYADGARNPLLSLDNIESKQMTDDFNQFLLTSVTGISNEKRKINSDSGTVSENTKCLVNTTGIEALSGELTEVQSRTFTIQFDKKYRVEGGYIEVDIIAQLKERRDDFLSMLMLMTSDVLRQMQAGGRQKCMSDLREALGDHSKSRCDDFLSLMLMLYRTAGAGVEGDGDGINDKFYESIRQINVATQETQQNTSPIAQAIESLYRSFEVVLEEPSKVSLVSARLQIRYREGEFTYLSARQLYQTLTRVASDGRMNWPYRNARHLQQRIDNDSDIILAAGYSLVFVIRGEGQEGYYNLKRVSRVGDGGADGKGDGDVFDRELETLDY
jgi:DNA primase